VITVTAVITDSSAAAAHRDSPAQSSPLTARTSRPAADRSGTVVRPRTGAVRSWPLLVLAAPAAGEVWSGWVGIAQKTGFGRVAPLPGIWPSLHLDTSITLPAGVECYAAYALRAWLDTGNAVSERTRLFAKRSAIFSFALGMAGQVAYHLLAQAGTARAPWTITTIVSCLPVLVLAMGTTLAHMLRADADGARSQDQATGDLDGLDEDDRASSAPGSPAAARMAVHKRGHAAGTQNITAQRGASAGGSGPPDRQPTCRI